MNYSLVNKIVSNFERYSERNAFFIGDKFFSYKDLKAEVYKIASALKSQVNENEKEIAILCRDDIYTYASILACWMSKKAYVPLNPSNPADRNVNILTQTCIKTLLCSDETCLKKDFSDLANVLFTNELEQSTMDARLIVPEENDLAYILFTSGSTGEPKGVKISHGNINSFVNHFLKSGYQLNENDRFLQIYDLSFDASVHCFTVPLSLGACIYTVPTDEIKYLYAYKLMKEQKLSFVKMPPSTLAYLKPFFNRIKLEELRYCLLGGEAFSKQLAEAWRDCVPNALIQNVYGPTEVTINCLIYNLNNEAKDYRGIVSIGKCFGENEAIVIDEQKRPLEDNREGELCLSGKQLTPGYWKNDLKNKEAFFQLEENGESKRYYKTGDLVIRDADGDYLYCGRIDSQVQIQGYRVELGEIEAHSREFLKLDNLAAIGVENEQSTTEIHLFTEGAEDKVEDLKKYLYEKLPTYMVPKKIMNLKLLPKTAGGKIDRSALRKISFQ